MKLIVVFAQRAESYPGQYAPEVYAAATEFENDDNPDYIQYQLEAAEKNEEFVAARILEIDLGRGSEDEIKRLLVEAPVIEGKLCMT